MSSFTLSTCRICMTNEDIAINDLFDYEFDHNLAIMIRTCLSISLSEYDELPKSICQMCYTKVREFNDFRKQASQSQERLLSLFSLQTCKTEPVSEEAYMITYNVSEFDMNDSVESTYDESISNCINNFREVTQTSNFLVPNYLDETCIVDPLQLDSQINDHRCSSPPNSPPQESSPVEKNTETLVDNDELGRDETRLNQFEENRSGRLSQRGLGFDNNSKNMSVMVVLPKPPQESNPVEKNTKTLVDNDELGRDETRLNQSKPSNSSQRQLEREFGLPILTSKQKLINCETASANDASSKPVEILSARNNGEIFEENRSGRLSQKGLGFDNNSKNMSVMVVLPKPPQESSLVEKNTETLVDNDELGRDETRLNQSKPSNSSQRQLERESGLPILTSEQKLINCETASANDASSKPVEILSARNNDEILEENRSGRLSQRGLGFDDNSKNMSVMVVLPKIDQIEDLNQNSHYSGELRLEHADLSVLSNSVKEPKLTCAICNRMFFTKRILISHIRSHEPEPIKKDLICKLCGDEFQKPSDLGCHLNHHMNTLEKTRCILCRQMLKSEAELQKHLIRVHDSTLVNVEKVDSNLYECAHCKKKYTSKQKFVEHLSEHESGGRHVCGICGKTYSTRKSCREHIRCKHSGTSQNVQCEICKRILSSKVKLQRHLSVHIKERNWICEICGKTFSHPRYLHEHKKIHSGIRPYVCNVCGKDFAQRGGYNIHKRSHTNNAHPYKCELCDKVFTQSWSLRCHMKKCSSQSSNHK